MRKHITWLSFILVVGLLLAWNFPITAASLSSTKITAVDVRQGKNGLEVVISAARPIEYKTVNLLDPRRALIIDISSAILWMKQTTIPVKNVPFAEQVRVGQFSSDPDIVRVVVYLTADALHDAKLSNNGKLLTVALNPTGITAAPKTVVTTLGKETHKSLSTALPKKDATVKLTINDVTIRKIASTLPVETLLASSHTKKAPAPKKGASKKPAAPMKEEAPAEVGNPLVSVSADNTDIVAIIKGFARDTNANIIIDDAVKGTITVKLVNVPLEQALSLVLTSKGFGFRRLSGNVLVVAPQDKLEKYEAARVAGGPVKTQVIPLENAKAGDLVNTIKLSIPDAKIEVDSRLNALVVKAPLDAIKEIKALVSQLDVPSVAPTPVPLTTEVIQLNYAVAKDVVNQMRGLIPANAVIVDERLNSLIVTGTAGVIDTVRNFLNAVDVPLPQVMLEMSVVSVTERGQKTLGLVHPASFNTTFNERERDKASTSTTEPAPFTVTEFIKPGFHTFTRTAISLTSTINLLVTNSEAKILASPKVATMNNKDATILVGERIPLVYYDPRAGLYQAQYIDTGVKLDVTPTISPDGYVTMKLSPQVSEVGEFIQNFPRIQTRSAQTVVRVKTGETVVIGGLIRETNTKAVTKYPLLGDIPIIGELFKNRAKTNEKVDLIITVTPKILAQAGGPAK